jgi:hypothetical protein
MSGILQGIRGSTIQVIFVIGLTAALAGCAWKDQSHSELPWQGADAARPREPARPAVTTPPARTAQVVRPAAGPVAAAPSGSSAKATPAVAGCAGSERCVARLKSMIDDPDRAWIGRREPPTTFVSGVRLFAYRALRTNLTCPELRSALQEIDAASRTFNAAVPGVAPEQATRVKALCVQVRAELGAENAARCAPEALGRAPPSQAVTVN